MQKDLHPPYTQEFKLIKQIGKGSFSNVWLAKCLTTNKQVAIKIIPKSILKKAEHVCALIKKEVRIHKQLIHKNIASFYKIFEDDTNNFMMMEYVKGNNLYNVANSMRKHGFPLIESDIRKYFIQILSAVNYLHNELHIVHRDLKLDNVMIDVNDDAKLIDFGFSSYIDDHDELKQSRGSPRYAAPEIFLKQESTTAVDMWALGIILYYCFSGYFPFDSENSTSELASKILFGKLEFCDNMDHNVRSLLHGLLRKNPHKRMTCIEAMRHPWIIDSNDNCEFLNENNDNKHISSENIKNNNNQPDENNVNLQDLKETNQNYSKEESIDLANTSFSIPSKTSTLSIQKNCDIPHFKNKRILKSSKSTFSENSLKKCNTSSKSPQTSNHRRVRPKKSANTSPLKIYNNLSRKT